MIGMSDEDVIARLVTALRREADRAAGARATLVSVAIEVMSENESGDIFAHIVRKTKTLVFATAELRDAAGAVLATASSVYKISA